MVDTKSMSSEKDFQQSRVKRQSNKSFLPKYIYLHVFALCHSLMTLRHRPISYKSRTAVGDETIWSDALL